MSATLIHSACSAWHVASKTGNQKVSYLTEPEAASLTAKSSGFGGRGWTTLLELLKVLHFTVVLKASVSFIIVHVEHLSLCPSSPSSIQTERNTAGVFSHQAAVSGFRKKITQKSSFILTNQLWADQDCIKCTTWVLDFAQLGTRPSLCGAGMHFKLCSRLEILSFCALSEFTEQLLTFRKQQIPSKQFSTLRCILGNSRKHKGQIHFLYLFMKQSSSRWEQMRFHTNPEHAQPFLILQKLSYDIFLFQNNSVNSV